jgi:glycosyltransferase involved in cell wall biosynthesis
LEKASNPQVSVIVTTRNEERNIGNCLQSIKRQNYKNLEIILVDNYSTDKTAQTAKKFDVKVFFKGNERSAQRNCGVEFAQGDFVLYLDADMILPPQLIEKCVERCRLGGFGALYVPERIVGEGFWIQVRDFERSFYTGTVVDAVRFIRRSLFLQVGGFDESLVGPEDWDFDRKIRGTAKVGVVDSFLLHNEGKFNMQRYLQKKNYYTEGIKKYVAKWGAGDAETVKQVGVRYRLVGVFVENGNWKKLVRNMHFAAAMYYLRFKVAVTYLKNN